MPLKEASYYETLEDNKVKCFLCPRNCIIKENLSGFCLVRTNKNGKLYTCIYEEITSIALDPIEKKPLYHYKPGSYILSIGTNGCNLDCKSCQNWQISRQVTPREYFPKEVIPEVINRYDTIGLCYTYNEPFIWFEYIKDTAPIVKEMGKDVVIVSNGIINPLALKEILPFVDAFNIDLKGMTKEYYLKYSSMPNSNVWDNLIEIKKSQAHLEVTKLIVPFYDDFNEKYFEKFAKWIREYLGKDTPLHLSRFFPAYKMLNAPPTPLEVMYMAYEVAKEYLDYVYLGNVPDEKYNSTYCPNCKALLVKRFGYQIKSYLKENKCPHCHFKLNFILF